MQKEIAVLFDLDGVVIDTETQYDVFWKKAGEDYQLGIENFDQKVKGITLPNIISTFFPHFSEEEAEKIKRANHEYELQMTMEYIPGALEFIKELRNNHIKLGLVTSSDDEKLGIVYDRLNLAPYFDTIVSADRITEGKPHPMCYLLAAKDLNVAPENCFVFEDSFHGIQSGNAAGMKVIGLSTTNSEDSIKNKVIKVIPDFQSFGFNNLVSLM